MPFDRNPPPFAWYSHWLSPWLTGRETVTNNTGIALTVRGRMPSVAMAMFSGGL